MLESEEFATWATENIVLVVGQRESTHKPVEVSKPAKGAPKTTCPVFPGITCDEHRTVYTEFTGWADDGPTKSEKPKARSATRVPLPSMPKSSGVSFPATWIVTPDVKAERVGIWYSPQEWIQKVGEAQKKLDEHPIPYSKLAEVHKSYADAEKAVKAGQWKPALAAIGRMDAALGGAWSKPIEPKVKAWLGAANAKAVSRFADAKGFRDPAAQVRGVKAVRDEFGQAMTAGPLPVIADVDAWLSQHGAAPPTPPAK